MAIDSISGLISTQAQQNVQRSNKTLQTALASLISGSKLTNIADDVATFTVASRLQSETGGLRQVSANLAQTSSLAQVADGGVEQIQNILEKLKTVAQQASAPTTNDSQRAQLNQQFKQLATEINRFAENTSFANKKLLDGSITGNKAVSLDAAFSGKNASEDLAALSIPSLSTTSLFSGLQLDISSLDGAQQALATIGRALQSVSQVRADIGGFLKATDFAAANIDSVLTNQLAATSALSDVDFAQASTNASQANILNSASLALLAQGNRLPQTLLKLVS